MIDNSNLAAVAAGVLVLLTLLTVFSVRSYKKRQAPDTTAMRHKEFHDKYVAQAKSLGIELTGKESSMEVSQLIGQHNRAKALSMNK